jgi:hypothetical protein
MPSLEKFERATPETSGVVQAHLRHIHRVCEMLNTFVFIRPSTVPTMRLIRAGFATKSMDIHDKSSDWGLTSGFVPVDQAFSKKQSNPPKPDIHPHGHGAAQAVHLKFTANQFTELWGARHFEHTTEVQAPQPPCHQSPDYRHFHSTKNNDVCLTASPCSRSSTKSARRGRRRASQRARRRASAVRSSRRRTATRSLWTRRGRSDNRGSRGRRLPPPLRTAASRGGANRFAGVVDDGPSLPNNDGARSSRGGSSGELLRSCAHRACVLR